MYRLYLEDNNSAENNYGIISHNETSCTLEGLEGMWLNALQFIPTGMHAGDLLAIEWDESNLYRIEIDSETGQCSPSPYKVPHYNLPTLDYLRTDLEAYPWAMTIDPYTENLLIHLWDEHVLMQYSKDSYSTVEYCDNDGGVCSDSSKYCASWNGLYENQDESCIYDYKPACYHSTIGMQFKNYDSYLGVSTLFTSTNITETGSGHEYEVEVVGQVYDRFVTESIFNIIVDDAATTDHPYYYLYSDAAGCYLTYIVDSNSDKEGLYCIEDKLASTTYSNQLFNFLDDEAAAGFTQLQSMYINEMINEGNLNQLAGSCVGYDGTFYRCSEPNDLFETEIELKHVDYESFTQGPTSSPTASPAPSTSPSNVPTSIPSVTPTMMPTRNPTNTPTSGPTTSPSNVPTSIPSVTPTMMPTRDPTNAPTSGPTVGPTVAPTRLPTSSPTAMPTDPEFNYVGTDLYGTDTYLAASHPSNFVDFDGDGDLDMFVGKNDGNIYYYENIGNSTHPSYDASVQNPFGLEGVASRAAPALVDIDDDGDFDIFVCNKIGEMHYFENNNNVLTLVATNGAFGGLYGAANCSPVFVDIDDDGDYDCIMGTEDGNMLYYENVGNAQSASFTASPITNAFGMTPKNKASKPTFYDIDGDGDFDFFKGDKNGKIYFQENVGDATTPSFDSPVEEPFGITDIGYLSAPVFADTNGDGLEELWVGSRDGALHLFERVR